MKHMIAIALLVLTMFAAPAAAGAFNGPPGSRVAFWLPDDWEIEKDGKDGEGTLVAMAPAKDAMVLLALAEAQNAEQAVGAIDGLLAKMLSDIKIGKAAKGNVNGMPAKLAKGTAKVNGKPVLVRVAIITTPSGKVLIGIGIVEKAKEKTYKPALEKVLKGIKPTA